MTRGRVLLLTAAWMLVPIAGCSNGGPDGGPASDLSPVVEIDTVVPVRRGEITESLELVGTLYPWRFATIVSEVDGVIERLPMCDGKLAVEVAGRKFSMEVPLDIGHEVKEDSILVEIDKRPFQLALDAANAKLAVTTKELENLLAWKRPEEVSQLEAQAEQADALLEQTKLDLDRYEELEDKYQKVISESERDAALAAYKSALAAKKQAAAALELAKAGPTPEEIDVGNAQVKLAESEVALRQDELEKCTIYCPYDAVIVDRYVGVGDRVTATPRVEIMQIIDPSLLLAQVNVPEKYYRLVKVNDLAEVEARGLSEPVPGLVALVNEKIDPETRTFRVRVGVENPKLNPDSASSERVFKSGSYVRVTLDLRSEFEALIVAADAVTFDKGQPAVFVFHGDKVEKRSVELGISSETEYEVTAGVSEGEKVVEGGTALLADGLPVRLKGREAPPAGPSGGGMPAARHGADRAGSGLPLAAEPGGARP